MVEEAVQQQPVQRDMDHLQEALEQKRERNPFSIYTIDECSGEDGSSQFAEKFSGRGVPTKPGDEHLLDISQEHARKAVARRAVSHKNLIAAFGSKDALKGDDVQKALNLDEILDRGFLS